VIVLLNITDDLSHVVARFTAACADETLSPERRREEARSYGYEIAVCLLRANPEKFDFVARMAAVEARKAGR
jgi:hypothetical protein